MIEAQRTVSLDLPLPSAVKLMHSIADTDERLMLKLWQKVLKAEGKLEDTESYLIAEELLTSFTENVTSVKGFEEATAKAYLTETPYTIRLTDIEGQEWNVGYDRSTRTFSDTGIKSHDESLSMYKDDGVGFSVTRHWRTEASYDQKDGGIDFISDSRKDAHGRTLGWHPNTQVGVELARASLLKLLANK